MRTDWFQSLDDDACEFTEIFLRNIFRQCLWSYLHSIGLLEKHDNAGIRTSHWLEMAVCFPARRATDMLAQGNAQGHR
jgi:hypothetical protein